MISCDIYDNGCNGGNGINVHTFVAEYGVALDSCKPYLSAKGQVPSCVIGCANHLEPFRRCKVKGDSIRAVVGEVAMKNEIFQNGPMYCGFKVMSDFSGYQGGVYIMTPGSSFSGGHAITVIKGY